VLVRLHGIPLGHVKVPVVNGCCKANVLKKILLSEHSKAITHHLLSDVLCAPQKLNGLRIEDLMDISHPAHEGPWPSVTVTVCTRDHTMDLKRCVESLTLLDYPELEILVVDNAPSDHSTERLISENYPNVRYVLEPRPGLNWARNRAILEAHAEIIAFTDDDVVVEPGWIRALAEVFVEDPWVMAVTGLVVPYELETEAQILFEEVGGFGRGFERKYYHAGPGWVKRAAKLYAGSGKMGTGANMAFRRVLFDKIGLFDPALDVGTPTGGGGDLEMFFRVVKEGYRLIYEPSALVRHVHRRDYAQLHSQMMGWGTGFYSHLMRSALVYSREAVGFLRLASWWLWERNLRRLLLSLIYPSPSTKGLIWAELWGSLTGMFRYFKARSIAARIENRFGSLPKLPGFKREKPTEVGTNRKNGIALRSVDLNTPVKALTDVIDYSSTRVFVTRNGRLLGSVDMVNHNSPISARRLRDSIVEAFHIKLLEIEDTPTPDFLKAQMLESLRQHCMPENDAPESKRSDSLPSSISVSVVVATYDRPDQLRNCLRCLTAQKTPRPVEIIVVDNHPDSQLTPRVVAEFPGVVLVKEPRQGLSYARNAGIVASKGQIIVSTDDDVTMPSDWVEKLVTPFAREDVMIVTGNVLPSELETPAQHLFEAYGGLSRGFERLEADRNWFESFGRRAVPTWRLGSTANAAFRKSIFSNSDIGLFDEALGAGTPTGCSEDTYLFYKVLKAGHTIVYEPGAYVWHSHRLDISALRRQIYAYSKGHVAYHVTTFMKDHDLRAVFRIVWELPQWHLKRIKSWVLRRSNYPLHLTAIEAFGNLTGPYALWRSRRRVKAMVKRKSRLERNCTVHQAITSDRQPTA
jgi:GT2 family glycosyltransferase